MNENTSYYSILYINGTKIISQTPNNPFLFNCYFDKDKLTITQRKKDYSFLVYYHDIKQIDVLVCSRLAGSIAIIPSLQYNLDLVVYTNENKSFHIEIPITSEFEKVIDILNKANVKLYDKLNIFHLFNEDDFAKTYFNYMSINFDEFAKQYKLDNPRMNYTINRS